MVRHIFLSNYWWQKSDIWSQASYRYPISWETYLNPSDSYFLFADFVDFYTHWTYMLIFRRIFLSNYWWQKSDIWSQASYRYAISWEAFLDPSDSYFLFADFVDFYTHLTYICICTFFVAFFSATIDGRNLIFGHKLPPLFSKQEVGIWRVKKRFPQYGVPIWSLWPNIRFLPSIVAEKNATKNVHIQMYVKCVILWEAFFDPSDSYFLFAEERGYHRWALAHSSSCFDCICVLFLLQVFAFQ
jgi:hypothetical protein